MMKCWFCCFRKNWHVSDTDLGVSFSGDCYALTQLAKERYGRLCARYQRSLLFWTQILVIWTDIREIRTLTENSNLKFFQDYTFFWVNDPSDQRSSRCLSKENYRIKTPTVAPSLTSRWHCVLKHLIELTEVHDHREFVWLHHRGHLLARHAWWDAKFPFCHVKS